MKTNRYKIFFTEISPPIVLRIFKKINSQIKKYFYTNEVLEKNFTSDKQDLGMYWNADMAAMLETWGKDHVWNELQMLLMNKKGKVFDIACGTGVTMQISAQNKSLEVYGCDISDFLIAKAIAKGIDQKMLRVCDATDLKNYSDDYFDYSYSIGSLEHFTEEGILKFISEVHRITKYSTYHMMPVSRNGRNHGWIKTVQSYFNNSTEWWISKFETRYDTPYVINSGWKDDISIGKWFVCSKNENNC